MIKVLKKKSYNLLLDELLFLRKLKSNNTKYLIASLIKDKNISKYFLDIPFSKSQLYQDLVILNYLNYKKKGFFVEIGAHNGIYASNTYLLEKKYLWDGILVEPAKVFHKDLNKNRNAKICRYVITEKSLGYIDFYEDKIPEYSGTKKVIGSKCYKIKSITINELLFNYNSPKNIDYLSIDIEGGEYEILKSLDYELYKPKCISVEHNYNKKKKILIKKLLESNNFTNITDKLNYWDDIYISNKFL